MLCSRAVIDRFISDVVWLPQVDGLCIAGSSELYGFKIRRARVSNSHGQ